MVYSTTSSLVSESQSTKTKFKPPHDAAVSQAFNILSRSFQHENAPNSTLGDTSNKKPRDVRQGCLDQEIDAIQTCLKALKDEAIRRMAPLRKERNTTIPIHTLPLELRTTILAYSIDQHASPAVRLAGLSTVSTSWWSLIADTPTLWAKIRTESVGLSVALTRSKNSTLDLIVESPRHNPPADQAAELVAAVFEHIGSQTHRWRSAHISNGFHPHIISVLEKEMPLLEVLSVSLGRVDLVPAKLGGGPNLRSIHLRQVNVALENAVLTGLESISIKLMPVDGSVWASQLLDALVNCPKLKEIELVRLLEVGFPSRSPLPASHILPTLRRLIIDSVCPEVVLHLLKSIRLAKPLSECKFINIDRLHTRLIQALSSGQNTVGQTFQHAIRNNDAQINIQGFSLAFGPKSREYWLQFTDITLGVPEAMARFCGAAVPAHVSIQDVHQFRRTIGLAFLDGLNIVDLSMDYCPDAMDVLKILDTHPCPNLATVHLNWEWTGYEKVSVKAKLLGYLVSLMQSRPQLEIYDVCGRRLGHSTDYFLGEPI